jgi:hypothetical protein
MDELLTHFFLLPHTTPAKARGCFGLPHAKEAENEEHHHHEANQVDDVVHGVSSSLCVLLAMFFHAKPAGWGGKGGGRKPSRGDDAGQKG